jgi:hypothetical protein
MARISYLLVALALLVGFAAARTAGIGRGRNARYGADAALRTSAENKAAAQSDAAALLAGLSLPPGAAQSSTEPVGDDALLAGPEESPATPNVLDDHAWWVVPDTPAEALGYLRAHLPSGARRSGEGQSGKRGGPRVVFETFEWPSIAGVLSQRSLDVEVVPLSNTSTGLRADAQVVWVTLRSPSEVIPPGAHVLRISARSTIAGNRPNQRPFTVTSLRKIKHIVALLNALPVSQPGVTNCPVDFGIDVRLAFYGHDASPLAVATVDAGGCSGVTLAIGGRAEPELEGEGLITGVDRVLGCKLDMSPRSPPVRTCRR